MTITGLLMLLWFYRKGGSARATPDQQAQPGTPVLWRRRLLLLFLMFLPMIIPSDWTQDVPARYGARHPGLEHSWLYPEVDN